MTQIYQIHIRGHLSDAWAEWFDGLDIENLPNGESVLSGPVADKAAPHSLLNGCGDLGLVLLSVHGVPPTTEKECREWQTHRGS
jgi:hypothetical protein